MLSQTSEGFVWLLKRWFEFYDQVRPQMITYGSIRANGSIEDRRLISWLNCHHFHYFMSVFSSFLLSSSPSSSGDTRGFRGLREFTRGQSLKDGSTPVWSQVPRHASSLIHISAINVNIRRRHPSVILPPHGIQNRGLQRHIRHMFSPFFSCCLLSFSPSLRHISQCFGQKTRRVFWWFIARSFYLF